MALKCDVLVVGGGPAGCSAAHAAAKKGLKTILIEKKDEIGKEVKCAEGIGEFLFPCLPFDIPNEQLIWKMDGMMFWTDGLTVENSGEFWNAYSVDRNRFDKWLSICAVNNGVQLLTDTTLIDLEFDDDKTVKKAIINQNGKTVEVIPQVIVAADGVESSVLQFLGLYHPKQGDIADVYSWEMRNLELYKPTFEQVFTGEFTPSGYAYIFPKGKDVANVGVGGIYPEKKLEQYFEEFIEIPHVKKQIRHADYVIEKSKKAVFNDLTDKWMYGNVLLAGDVANQNLKPFIEGILPSIICGDVAGLLSYQYCMDKKIDDSIYRDAVNKKIGEHFQISEQLLNLINYLYAKKGNEKYLQFFGIITELLDPEEIEETENLNYTELKSRLKRLTNDI